MANNKQKLELTWVGKDEQPKLEPRILIEDPSMSYGDRSSENMLIYGDNLLALKALEQDFTGKIKCVFIDPPYNTGSAFEQYDDGIEHSMWLSLMRDRLVTIRRLLTEDGSLWITIDDNEAHYLKILLDEVFGRKNFVANVLWQKVYSDRMDAKEFSISHDHLLVYKCSDLFQVKRLSVEQNDKQFNFFDEAVNKHYRRRSLRKEGSNSLREDRPNLWYAVKAPDGSEIFPIKPSGIEGNWRWSKETYEKNVDLNLVEWVKTPRGWEVYVKQYKDNNATRPPNTWWLCEDVGHNHEAKEEARSFNPANVFATPKPERLIQRIMTISTEPGDLILDSFAGSGTTGAVAHKMGRRWIMVELGEHCRTHIIPRLKKVIEGEDKGGVTEATGWKGGGGFRYYYLAPSLLKKDKYNNWVMDERYNPTMLAAAMAKQEGFKYCPDETLYWKQGQSTEKDFIYTTTSFITVEHLSKIKEEMKPGESLLICCKSFQVACANRFPNITLKKIPNMLLGRCEFGKEDYSLNIVNMPVDDDEEEEPAELEAAAKPVKKEAKKKAEKVVAKDQTDLFTDGK